MPRRSDLLWTVSTIVAALAVLLFGGARSTEAEPAGVLGVALTVAACAPIAVRRAYPVAAAVVALPLAAAALALGYLVIVPVLAALVLSAWAAIHSAQRVTVPLAAYAGTLLAVGVTATGEGSPVVLRLPVGLAIGIAAVLIGDAIRSERERTEAAVVAERLRIARDVHDITGHHLSAIALQAAGASRTTADPEARAALERIHGLTSEALGQTRRALGALRSAPERAPTPRLDRVDELLEPARDAGLAVDLRLDGAGRPLPDEVEVCAYRVVQESLTNVVRHARATAVRVQVSYSADELRIAVDDDGAGGTDRPGAGIRGMRERVAIVGGTFSAGPAAEGWSVRARLPLQVAS